jgi:putative selenate reductase
MTPIPFDKLIKWMISEYKTSSSVFGIDKGKFCEGQNAGEMFGSALGSFLGPAAGPNTQLAQNLVAAYVSGFRFMELKTVQTLDGEDLAALIPRPCINAMDEGYNVEWSTELTVSGAYEEYVKGWFAVHIAAKEFGLSEQCDAIFNMSVGYDYEGITSPKIDTFINEMKDASGTDIFEHCRTYLVDNIGLFENVTVQDVKHISPSISASITLSTLHGCPPLEIEKLADYFLSVKGLHTFVKVNPTLLGYDFVRDTLDKMGYNYIAFDHQHFDQDLKPDDAEALIERLQTTASKSNLEFGVKVSNTFPVQIKNDELPGEHMYMSGRALYVLSVNVAKMLSERFDGKLAISYSGGADFFNVERLLAVGIKPVTVATTILKPGGYARAKQMCETVSGIKTPKDIDVSGLAKLAQDALSDKHLNKEYRAADSRKTESKLSLYDCYKAPCADGGCPIGQQIPEYLNMVEQGKYKQALRIITIDNPLPSILGEICDHVCQDKCTRLDYDQPLQIRSAKKMAADNAQNKLIGNTEEAPLVTDKKAVIIGAGPAGIAAGAFLRRNGVNVTIMEKRDRPMGIVQYIIPEFRISNELIDRDVNMALKEGVQIEYNCDENYDITKLKERYDFVIVATGAWKEGYCPVQSGQEHLIEALDFLLESKAKKCAVDLGKNVAVIGGGDVAMDCARAAKRAPGVQNVHIVYRRTQEFMPAEREEIALTLADGVEFKELLSPLTCSRDSLEVQMMQLGEKDTDGRRKTLPTQQTDELQYDTVISAIGARVDKSLLESNNIDLSKLKDNNESNIDGVYIAGDCARGAATIVQAVADSKTIAVDILDKCGIANDFIKADVPLEQSAIRERKAVLADASADKDDCARCLSCEQLCEICCEVCPNRANISIVVNGKPQIVHIDGMCNECGNCEVFCPHTGDPAKDKPTLFWDTLAFDNSRNSGWVYMSDDRVLVRDAGGEEFEAAIGDKSVSSMLSEIIEEVKRSRDYIIV